MNFRSVKEALAFLGFSEHISLPEIKSAYKEFVKAYHPDANPGMYEDVTDRSVGSSMDAYLKMQSAYEYLLDHLEESSVPKEDPDAKPVPRGNVVYGSRSDLSTLAFQKKVRTEHVRQERRSKERAKKEKADFEEKMEKYKQDKKYEEAMQKIHTERAAEITAKIIEAYLKGDL
ncbi:MAG: DnaJ domain-containing protein [Lachnospiraceae bacterium]|nr:DnaJ domain-containing protein [Lachnospiraceae bacterium]